MPKAIAVEEMPAFVRTRADSAHSANVLALREWLQSDASETQALVFDKNDGISKETLGGTTQALRNAAKVLKCRLRVRYTETKNLLYVSTDGEYIPMTDEKRAERAAKRAATEAKKSAPKAAAKGRR